MLTWAVCWAMVKLQVGSFQVMLFAMILDTARVAGVSMAIAEAFK